MSDLEFEELDTVEPVGKHYIDYDKHNIKLKRRRTDWIENLGHVVAQAHFCRILVHPGSQRITLVGRKSDCEVAEYVLVTLQRAAEKMAHRAYYKYWFELFEICSVCQDTKTRHDEFRTHKFQSSTYKASGFKASWLDGFVGRLAQRYREQKQTSTSGQSTALVRVNCAEADVLQFINDNFKSSAKGLSMNTRFNREGLRQGKETADKLDLGSPKVVHGGKAQRSIT